MLPILSGEEAIRAANTAALGAGNLDADDRRALVESWTQHARRRPAPNTAPDARRLGAMGIGLRHVVKTLPTPADDLPHG